MSILSSLGLVKETETKPVEEIPVQPIVKTGGRRKSSSDTEEETEEVSPTPSTTTNKEVEKRLRKAAENSGGEGFDFSKFVKMLNKNKNLDETANYSTALSAAETMGVSIEELVSSAMTTIKAVNSEAKKIDADLSEQAEQNTLDQTELKKITSQISSLMKRQEELNNKINSSTSTIEESQRSLESTVQLVISDIKEIVSKIKKNSK